MPPKDKQERYRLTGRKVCPFHKYSTRTGIYCTGFFEKSSLGITFGDISDKQEYQRRYCTGEWRKCHRAATLTKLIDEHKVF